MSRRPSHTRVAIDGPGGAGKTSVGRMVAGRLGYGFFDTGLMYRAVTWAAIRSGVPASDAPNLRALAEKVEAQLEKNGLDARVLVAGEDVTGHLRAPEVDRQVSAISAVPAVREALVRMQRGLAACGDIVMVGRDIGTVVLPEADVKVYLTASAETRARRRRQQASASAAWAGEHYETVLADLKRRDDLDSTRATAPLKPAVDARIIDTDQLTIEQVVDTVARLVENC